MNKEFVGLSILMAGTVLGHVYLGGPEFPDQFSAELTSDKLRAMSLALWHAATVVLIAFSVSYLILARRPNPALLWLTSLIQLAWVLLFICYGMAFLGEIWTMPQWVLFLAFPLLALWAERRRSARLRAAA